MSRSNVREKTIWGLILILGVIGYGTFEIVRDAFVERFSKTVETSPACDLPNQDGAEIISSDSTLLTGIDAAD